MKKILISVVYTGTLLFTSVSAAVLTPQSVVQKICTITKNAEMEEIIAHVPLVIQEKYKKQRMENKEKFDKSMALMKEKVKAASKHLDCSKYELKENGENQYILAMEGSPGVIKFTINTKNNTWIIGLPSKK